MIEPLRLFVTLLCFGISAYLDIKYREVPNRFWLVFGSVGFSLTVYVLQSIPYLLFGLLFVFWFALFYVGALGGADAKGLMCLTLMLPSGATNSVPLFPLYCLVMGSALTSVQLVYAFVTKKDVKKVEVPLLAYLFVGVIVISLISYGSY